MKKTNRNCKWLIGILMFVLVFFAVSSGKAMETYAATHPIRNVNIKVLAKGSALNAISIKWDKTSYASGYAIFRKTPSEKAYKRIANVRSTVSSYMDKGLKNAQEYHYVVRAYRKVDGKNVYSKYTPLAMATRPAKTTVTAKLTGTDRIKLSWTKVENVSGYRIYRKQNGQSAWKVLRNVSPSVGAVTNSGLKAGVKYTYCVRAYKTAGGKTYLAGLSVSNTLEIPDTNKTYPKLNSSQKDVMKKIMYAVETGGQVYGNQDYTDFTEAYTNSSAEHAITIGAGQWYGTEAQRLLKFIYATDPETFKAIDVNGAIYKAMMNEDWSTYKLKKTSGRAKWIKKIISTPAGIKCQDQLMYEQIEEYEEEIRKLGITEPKSVCMFINIRHQGGYGAVTRVLAKTKKPVTLDNIYDALQTDTGNQVGAYKTRQAKVYGWLNTYM